MYGTQRSLNRSQRGIYRTQCIAMQVAMPAELCEQLHHLELIKLNK